jgi:hypothetical protein
MRDGTKKIVGYMEMLSKKSRLDKTMHSYSNMLKAKSTLDREI